MGWGAAYAWAEEMGFSPEDAHDMLYGEEPKPWRCPICSKKCKSRRGVLDHADATHKKADHIRRVADWWAETAQKGTEEKDHERNER